MNNSFFNFFFNHSASFAHKKERLEINVEDERCGKIEMVESSVTKIYSPAMLQK